VKETTQGGNTKACVIQGGGYGYKARCAAPGETQQEREKKHRIPWLQGKEGKNGERDYRSLTARVGPEKNKTLDPQGRKPLMKIGRD